jgi:hypothetical protein
MHVTLDSALQLLHIELSLPCVLQRSAPLCRALAFLALLGLLSLSLLPLNTAPALHLRYNGLQLGHCWALTR